jgi:hypothetical protein
MKSQINLKHLIEISQSLICNYIAEARQRNVASTQIYNIEYVLLFLFLIIYSFVAMSFVV